MMCPILDIAVSHGQKNLYVTFDKSFIGVEHFNRKVIRFKVNVHVCIEFIFY